MIPLLNRPYPAPDANKLGQRALIIGGLVFLLLFLFRPFGLHQLALSIAIFDTLMYGLISAGFIYVLGRVLPLLFPAYFNEDHWTVGRETLSILIYTAIIAIGNYAYSIFRDYTDFSWNGFLLMLASTLSVAAVIVFVVVLITANRTLKRHLHAAQGMNANLHTNPHTPEQVAAETIVLPSEVESQRIKIIPDHIICLTSDANYIDCTYLDAHGEIQEERIRNRMKVLEELLTYYPFLFRCHRAFIVNLIYVQEVEGNAKGYTLHLKNYDFPVPVARSKSKELQVLLEQF